LQYGRLLPAEGFSPQKIQLPSGGVNDQAIFLGHECDPQNELGAQFDSEKK
jgi:hypothetical protein